MSEFRPSACGVTVTCYCWAPSTGDHFIHMWRHIKAATQISPRF